jgi:transposase
VELDLNEVSRVSAPRIFEFTIAGLLAAFGEDRSRFASAQSFMSYVGIAPVKEESGKKCWVHWRWSCPIFLRQTNRSSISLDSIRRLIQRLVRPHCSLKPR